MVGLQWRRWQRGAMAMCIALLAGCGGGGGNGAGNSASSASGSASSSTFAPSSSLANMCTVASEQRFVRSYIDEVYLWYREVPGVDASLYSSVTSYFYALLVTTPDPNGLPKDQFSFVVNAKDADAFSTGVNVGYGVQWKLDAQGRQRVALIAAGSPAADAGMARGGQLVQILERTPASWYPNQAGAFARFLYSDTPGTDAREITLNARTVKENPVPLVSSVTTPAGKTAAYVLFNDHAEGAQDKLIAAMQTIQSQGLQELVLDLRYNSGGYLYIAQSLASMISGPRAYGQVFESLRYNDKRDAESRSSAFAFSGNVEYGESTYSTGYTLPRLNLRRVYVLTSQETCSASESVINGLRGVDVDVVLIGAATCGKPYGFTRKDNCGRSYFPIEFKGTNAKGFGDYSAGFAPTCAANDDLEHSLGDNNERQLASALHHIDTGQCSPAQARGFMPQAGAPIVDGLPADAVRPPHGRLLRPPT